ncbi:phosphoethanolamine transferase [Algibacter sp. AS12]|uniref:phosphoethanolamine transferase n=1 Tax=Algibacter sp. AS12 TaxID=3135773 RepID=UPI00398B9D72
MNKLLETLILYSIPLLSKYIFIFFFGDIELIIWIDILEDILFYVFVLNFLVFFKYKLICNLLLFFYILYFIIETSSFIAVSSNFTSSFMFVLIETNGTEFKEFLSAYFDVKIVFYVIFMFGLFIILRVENLKYKITNWFAYSIVSSLLIIGTLKLTGFIEHNAYHNIVRGIYGYKTLHNNYQLSKNNISDSDLVITSNNDVFVVVLGESTNRNHMQLYDYYKNTTPLLESIKDSLYVYNNVISTDVLTLKAMPKILTSMDNKTGFNPGNILNIVSVFNAAGYKTFWLSNQRPISYHDNFINKVASSSNYFKFYNYKVDKHASGYDGIMLSDYKKILNEEGKKVVFIRLLGTHFDYNKRYPKSFSRFKPKDSSTKEKIISDYDNAILYNDYIVYSMLDELRKKNKKSAFLYFSDHGENVYDQGEFFGRNEANLKQSMFEIPFIFWGSKTFEKPTDFVFQSQRKFMSDHFYESMGHVFGIMHKDMDVNKSIFSSSFKKRERAVVNGVNFDEYFLESNEN